MAQPKLQQPQLLTPRLQLRGFRLEDAPAVQLLAGDFAIADTTANVPHPYEDGMAQQWMADRETALHDGRGLTCAITQVESGDLVGAVGLEIDWPNRVGEVGYWVGRPYWNRGYATEALGAMLQVAFETVLLNRVQARHLARNPASGKVMAKCGMEREARIRSCFRKWGKFEDAVQFAILFDQYKALS